MDEEYIIKNEKVIREFEKKYIKKLENLSTRDLLYWCNYYRKMAKYVLTLELIARIRAIKKILRDRGKLI